MTSALPSRLVRAVAAAAAALLIGTLATAPVRADSADTKKELDAAKAKLADLEDSIAADQAALDELQAEADALAVALDGVKSRIARTQLKIIKKQGQIDEAVTSLNATQDQLDQRAWVAYVYGPGSTVEFLLGSTSLSDLNDRLEIVNSAAQSDHDLIIDLQEHQNRLRSRAAELESLQTNLQEDQADLTAQQKDFEGKIAEAQAAFERLQADFAAADAMVVELGEKYDAEVAAEEKARLEALRKAREQQQQQGGGGGDLGAYAGVFKYCPVGGFVSFSDEFGAPRTGHLHAGNDMFAARGTPIVAPFSGRAEDASNGIGGLAVKVFGDDGWVYNAHADAIIKTGPVSAGDTIALVGNTGNAQGTSPHDHFEFHPYDPSRWPAWTSPYGVSMLGDAVDPYPFLVNAC